VGTDESYHEKVQHISTCSRNVLRLSYSFLVECDFRSLPFLWSSWRFKSKRNLLRAKSLYRRMPINIGNQQ
jgi:hypothetical protein